MVLHSAQRLPDKFVIKAPDHVSSQCTQCLSRPVMLIALIGCRATIETRCAHFFASFLSNAVEAHPYVTHTGMQASALKYLKKMSSAPTGL